MKRSFKCPKNPDISPEMKGLIESMLQYDEDERIGWAELADEDNLEDSMLAPMIGWTELADEDNMED
jgi:hypothetical protein